jgi:hypothetical protein
MKISPPELNKLVLTLRKVASQVLYIGTKISIPEFKFSFWLFVQLELSSNINQRRNGGFGLVVISISSEFSPPERAIIKIQHPECHRITAYNSQPPPNRRQAIILAQNPVTSLLQNLP